MENNFQSHTSTTPYVTAISLAETPAPYMDGEDLHRHLEAQLDAALDEKDKYIQEVDPSLSPKKYKKKRYDWYAKPCNQDGYNLINHLSEADLKELAPPPLEIRAVKLFHRNPWMVNSYTEVAKHLQVSRRIARQVIEQLVKKGAITKRNNFYPKKDGATSKKYKRNFYRVTALGRKWIYDLVRKIKGFTSYAHKKTFYEGEVLLNPKQLKFSVRKLLAELGIARSLTDSSEEDCLRRKKLLTLLLSKKDLSLNSSGKRTCVDKNMPKAPIEEQRLEHLEMLKNDLGNLLFRREEKNLEGNTRTVANNTKLPFVSEENFKLFSQLIDAFAKEDLLDRFGDLSIREVLSLLKVEQSKLSGDLAHIRSKLDKGFKPRPFIAYLRHCLKSDEKTVGYGRFIARGLREAIDEKSSVVADKLMTASVARESVELIRYLEKKTGIIATEKELITFTKGQYAWGKLRTALQFTEDRYKKGKVTKSWVGMTIFALPGVKDRYQRKEGSTFYKKQEEAAKNGSSKAKAKNTSPNHEVNRAWLQETNIMNSTTAIFTTADLKTTDTPEKTHILYQANDEKPYKTLVSFFKPIQGKWQKLSMSLGKKDFIELAEKCL